MIYVTSQSKLKRDKKVKLWFHVTTKNPFPVPRPPRWDTKAKELPLDFPLKTASHLISENIYTYTYIYRYIAYIYIYISQKTIYYQITKRKKKGINTLVGFNFEVAVFFSFLLFLSFSKILIDIWCPLSLSSTLIYISFTVLFREREAQRQRKHFHHQADISEKEKGKEKKEKKETKSWF